MQVSNAAVPPLTELALEKTLSCMPDLPIKFVAAPNCLYFVDALIW